jgi:hypothetical protein
VHIFLYISFYNYAPELYKESKLSNYLKILFNYKLLQTTATFFKLIYNCKSLKIETYINYKYIFLSKKSKNAKYYFCILTIEKDLMCIGTAYFLEILK